MSRYPGTIGLPKPLWITQFRPDKGGPDNARTTVYEVICIFKNVRVQRSRVRHLSDTFEYHLFINIYLMPYVHEP